MRAGMRINLSDHRTNFLRRHACVTIVTSVAIPFIFEYWSTARIWLAGLNIPYVYVIIYAIVVCGVIYTVPCAVLKDVAIDDTHLYIIKNGQILERVPLTQVTKARKTILYARAIGFCQTLKIYKIKYLNASKGKSSVYFAGFYEPMRIQLFYSRKEDSVLSEIDYRIDEAKAQSKQHKRANQYIYSSSKEW